MLKGLLLRMGGSKIDIVQQRILGIVVLNGFQTGNAGAQLQRREAPYITGKAQISTENVSGT